MPAIADRIDALVRKHPGSNYAMRSAPVAMWTERASGSCRWGSSGGSVRRATPAIIRSIGRGTEKPEPRLAGFYGAGRTVGDVPAADAIERRRQKESPARAWDRNGASASVGKRKVPEVNQSVTCPRRMRLSGAARKKAPPEHGTATGRVLQSGNVKCRRSTPSGIATNGAARGRYSGNQRSAAQCAAFRRQGP